MSATDRLKNLLDFYFTPEAEYFHILAIRWRNSSLSFTFVIIQRFFLCQEAYYFHNNPRKFDLFQALLFILKFFAIKLHFLFLFIPK